MGDEPSDSQSPDEDGEMFDVLVSPVMLKQIWRDFETVFAPDAEPDGSTSHR